WKSRRNLRPRRLLLPWCRRSRARSKMFTRATWRRTGSRDISRIRRRSNAKPVRARDESYKESGADESGAEQKWSEEERGEATARRSTGAPSCGRGVERRSRCRPDTNAVAGFSADRAAAGDGPEPAVSHGRNLALRRSRAGLVLEQCELRRAYRHAFRRAQSL